MEPQQFLTDDERSEILALINDFENHGCRLGLDLKAQKALQRLLNAIQLEDQQTTIVS